MRGAKCFLACAYYFKYYLAFQIFFATWMEINTHTHAHTTCIYRIKEQSFLPAV